METKSKTNKKPNGTSFKHSEVDQIFNLVKMQDGNIHITVGNNIVSRKTFKTFKKADEYLASKPYEILINVACLIVNTQKQNETETKNEKVE